MLCSCRSNVRKRSRVRFSAAPKHFFLFFFANEWNSFFFFFVCFVRPHWGRLTAWLAARSTLMINTHDPYIVQCDPRPIRQKELCFLRGLIRGFCRQKIFFWRSDQASTKKKLFGFWEDWCRQKKTNFGVWDWLLAFVDTKGCFIDKMTFFARSVDKKRGLILVVLVGNFFVSRLATARCSRPHGQRRRPHGQRRTWTKENRQHSCRPARGVKSSKRNRLCVRKLTGVNIKSLQRAKEKAHVFVA